MEAPSEAEVELEPRSLRELVIRCGERELAVPLSVLRGIREPGELVEDSLLNAPAIGATQKDGLPLPVIDPGESFGRIEPPERPLLLVLAPRAPENAPLGLLVDGVVRVRREPEADSLAQDPRELLDPAGVAHCAAWYHTVRHCRIIERAFTRKPKAGRQKDAKATHALGNHMVLEIADELVALPQRRIAGVLPLAQCSLERDGNSLIAVHEDDAYGVLHPREDPLPEGPDALLCVLQGDESACLADRSRALLCLDDVELFELESGDSAFLWKERTVRLLSL